MNPLTSWIEHLLAQSIAKLDRKYAFAKSGTAYDELEILKLDPVDSGDVPDEIVGALHLKIRGRDCEAPLWDALVFHLRKPLPVQVAHDLIDRDVIVTQLGHTRQKDEVQWRLASLVPEALLTLVWELFTKPTYTAEELEKLLSQHLDHSWLLSKWEHEALLSSQVRDREKEVIFHRWAWQHPERSSARFEVPTLERYLEMLDNREREQKRIKQEKEEDQLRVEREVEQRRLEIEYLSQRVLTEEEVREMFSVRDPDEILALARNAHLPTFWLKKLLNCYGIKGSRQIRQAAQENFDLANRRK